MDNFFINVFSGFTDLLMDYIKYEIWRMDD
jgi:hypothetical protein